jgi:hypothetical protein
VRTNDLAVRGDRGAGAGTAADWLGAEAERARRGEVDPHEPVVTTPAVVSGRRPDWDLLVRSPAVRGEVRCGRKVDRVSK